MVDQAPAGITFKNEHGLDCVLVVMHIEDAHEFEAHIADESDLRAAGFVKLSGSDGPTCDHKFSRRTRDTWECGGCGAFRKEGSLEWVLPAWRKDYNEGFAAGLALGEQKQAARVEEIEALNRKGSDEYFRVTRALRAERNAAESELAATKAKLAEVERELASALRVSEGRARQRDELSIAYHRNQTVVEAIKAWKAAHAAWMKAGKHASTRDIVAAEMELNDALKALASAGMDADRAEVPKCTGCSSPTKELCVEDGCRMPICARCYHDHDRHEHLPRIGDVKQPERLSVGGSPMVQWTSKLPGGTTLLNGFLLAQPDGSLRVCVDDGHYSGDVEPADALRLARRILTAYGQGETGRNNDRSASAEPSAQAYPQYGQPVSTEPPTCSAFCDIPGCPKQHGGSVESAPERQPEVERDDGSEQE